MTKQTRRTDSHDGPDMSSAGIDLRLRELAQLYSLGLSLTKGRWVRSRGGDRGGREAKS